MSNKVAPGTADKKEEDAGGGGGGGGGGASEIDISISCRNLENKDQFSKSDPICVISQRSNTTKKWTELMRTEIMENNLNPKFSKKLTIEYKFEVAQSLQFHIYDVDDPSAPFEEDDSLGFIECTVANIVAAGAKGYVQKLQTIDGDKETSGIIALIAEEKAAMKDEIYLQLVGSQVGTYCCCCGGKSFFCILRRNDAGVYLMSHRSPESSGTNPRWTPMDITIGNLCNGDGDRQLKIEIWRKTRWSNEDRLIGFAFTTLNKMLNSTEDPWIASVKLKTPNGRKCPTSISIVRCNLTPVFTFMDYIQAGTRIHLCFSIDFTSSNGDPCSSGSLHRIYADPKITKQNPYEQAIQATGLVMKDYNSTNIYKVYGFGARIPPGVTSQCFNVTLEDSPDCEGIPGVIRAYKNCLRNIQLYGPTTFAPVISIVAKMAEESSDGGNYYLLVILTDGVMSDLSQTKQAIVRASGLPMSIVIIGVGEADFSDMEVLDGDRGTLIYDGQKAERDIVQFVAYRSASSWMKRMGEETVAGSAMMAGVVQNAIAKAKDQTDTLAPGKLAEEILAEIPGQITSYMEAQGITPSMVPKPPEDDDDEEVNFEPEERDDGNKKKKNDEDDDDDD